MALNRMGGWWELKIMIHSEKAGQYFSNLNLNNSHCVPPSLSKKNPTHSLYLGRGD